MSTEISPAEEQVIYYVAGYIVFALRKKYISLLRSKPHNCSVKAALQFLDSINTTQSANMSGNSYEEFVRKWTKLVSRGYLIEVNQEMYYFVKQVEIVVRSILNTQFIIQYHGEDLRDIIQKKISDSMIVTESWNSLSRTISNETLANVLRKQIVVKWIDVRANSFVNTYVQILKRKINSKKIDPKTTTLSDVAEPSLRKTLYTK